MSTNQSHVLILQERNSGNTPQVQYTRGLDLSGTIEGAGGIGGLLMRNRGNSGGIWSTHNAYHSDANGNVTAMMNSSGVLQALYKWINASSPVTFGLTRFWSRWIQPCEDSGNLFRRM